MSQVKVIMGHLTHVRSALSLTKNMTATNSRMRSHAPFKPIEVNICIRCRVANAIIFAKFKKKSAEVFRGYEISKKHVTIVPHGSADTGF